jgi:hypothetical protein
MAVSALLKQTIAEYVRAGVYPGGFAEAILTGDLGAAKFRADSHNSLHFSVIVDYVNTTVPAEARGSVAAFQRHRQQHGCADKA